MGVYKEGKNWKVQVYYKDWQGNQKRKQKRGFRTKGEAKEWERDFLQQQSQGVDIEFGNFLEIYYKDMDVRLREHTMYTKRYIIDLKIRPYFEKKILSEITEYNYTEFSENESYQYLSEQEKGKDRIQERNEYRQLIHDNIEYEILCQSYGTGRVEELVELMLDAICSTKPYQQINGEAVPTQVVKSRLLKVGYEHIQYVFFSLDRSTSKVKNIRQYMLTVLYNAPATINQFYDAEVRHDMYWGKDIPDG